MYGNAEHGGTGAPLQEFRQLWGALVPCARHGRQRRSLARELCVECGDEREPVVRVVLQERRLGGGGGGPACGREDLRRSRELGVSPPHRGYCRTRKMRGRDGCAAYLTSPRPSQLRHPPGGGRRI